MLKIAPIRNEFWIQLFGTSTGYNMITWGGRAGVWPTNNICKWSSIESRFILGYLWRKVGGWLEGVVCGRCGLPICSDFQRNRATFTSLRFCFHIRLGWVIFQLHGIVDALVYNESEVRPFATFLFCYVHVGQASKLLIFWYESSLFLNS